MALDKEKQEEVKPVKKTTYKVLKRFTLDKEYFPTNKIELEDGKVTEKLISNKIIK